MGLLEEAIREHLDLKRKHGASDEELLREEADALGPARREDLAPEQAESEPGAEAAVAQEELVDEEPPAAAPEPEHEEPPEPPTPAEKPLLEESPDFLPEAPGEDGRASEQRSPRDFDFD
jgi:hypothetical protein